MAHPTLSTQDLLLRPLVPADAPEIFSLNTNQDVMRYLPKDEVYTSLQQAQGFLTSYLAKTAAETFARQAVVRISDGAWLGWCGLREQVNGEVDLGFRLHQRYWGHGYATAAGRAWVNYGLREAGLKRIVANTAADNLGSQRTLEKIGFRRFPAGDHDADGFTWLKYDLKG